MKTTRFFIVLGACALVFTIALGSIESCLHPCWAQTPVRRADPWAGDPEEPGFAKQIPFDDGAQHSRITVPYETTEATRTLREKAPFTVWSHFLRFKVMLTLFGRGG